MVGARPSFDGAAELQPLALGGGRGAAPFGRRVPPGACRLAGLAREPYPPKTPTRWSSPCTSTAFL